MDAYRGHPGKSNKIVQGGKDQSNWHQEVQVLEQFPRIPPDGLEGKKPDGAKTEPHCLQKGIKIVDDGGGTFILQKSENMHSSYARDVHTKETREPSMLCVRFVPVSYDAGALMTENNTNREGIVNNRERDTEN